MNRRIVRFGLVAVAVAVVVAIGLNLRPASNSGAQVTSSPRAEHESRRDPGEARVPVRRRITWPTGRAATRCGSRTAAPRTPTACRSAIGGRCGRPTGGTSPIERGIDTVLVTDAEGHLVASLPGISLHTVSWSPYLRASPHG